MKCKKNFLFALVAFAFLICVLPAAIAGSNDNPTVDDLIVIDPIDVDSADIVPPVDDSIVEDTAVDDSSDSTDIGEVELFDNDEIEPTDEEFYDDSPEDWDQTGIDDVIANFSADNTTGYSPLNVTFYDTSRGCLNILFPLSFCFYSTESSNH